MSKFRRFSGAVTLQRVSELTTVGRTRSFYLDLHVQVEIGSELDLHVQVEIGSELDLHVQVQIGSDLDVHVQVQIGPDLNLHVQVEIGSALDLHVQVEIGSDLDLHVQVESGSDLTCTCKLRSDPTWTYTCKLRSHPIWTCTQKPTSETARSQPTLFAHIQNCALTSETARAHPMHRQSDFEILINVCPAPPSQKHQERTRMPISSFKLSRSCTIKQSNRKKTSQFSALRVSCASCAKPSSKDSRARLTVYISSPERLALENKTTLDISMRKNCRSQT